MNIHLGARVPLEMDSLEFFGQQSDATMSTTATSAIFETNPYESHPSLSPLEADVLWEYAKLSQHIKEVRGGAFFERKEPQLTCMDA